MVSRDGSGLFVHEKDPNIAGVLAEGIFVGYRHYDAVHKPTLFPFGAGKRLGVFSDTALSYSNQIHPQLHDLRVLYRET